MQSGVSALLAQFILPVKDFRCKIGHMSNPSDSTIAIAKDTLRDAIPLAVATLKELMALSDKDSVRLAAAESILERGGLPKRQEIAVRVDQAEHALATQEANEMMAALQRNMKGLPSPQISLEALVVHEGEGDVVVTPEIIDVDPV